MTEPTLNSDRVVETIERLGNRIEERFPDSGLGKVCRELHGIASRARHRSAQIARPFVLLRLFIGIFILGAVGAAIAAGMEMLELRGGPIEFSDFVTVTEAGLNVVVLCGAAIFFLVTLEIRIKRRRALTALHELRSIAHVIDMHQLTKDPERLRGDAQRTKSSPVPEMTRYELGRYLDYCSEMLSLNGKVAALYIQHFDDTAAVGAANEIEQLTTALARKIWQKIMTLPHESENRLSKPESPAEPSSGTQPASRSSANVPDSVSAENQ